MKHILRRQEGQSLLIIAGALVLLVAFMALVVDAGNAYVQRRKVQNAMDAGSRAGAIAWWQGKFNNQVDAAAKDYAVSNGVDRNKVTTYYMVQDGSGNSVVSDQSIQAMTPGEHATTAVVGENSYPIVGVNVIAQDVTFNTYFAGVVGIRTMQVAGGSSSYLNGGGGGGGPGGGGGGGGDGSFPNKGPCKADGLFPIALNSQTFDSNGDGVLDIDFTQDDETAIYRIWDKRANPQNKRGNFGYLRWNDYYGGSDTQLADNMMHPENSGVWRVGDYVWGNTGVSEGTAVRNALNYYKNNKPVLLPVTDSDTGSGSNLKYHISGFAQFLITEYDLQGSDKWIEGQFLKFLDAMGPAGCAYYGGATVTTSVTPPQERALVGVVQIMKLGSVPPPPSPQYKPVDVVEVLDISGSMDGSSGFGSNKLAAAKNALKSFNTNLRPAQGDQVGLVTFPRITGGSNYNYRCTQNGRTSTYYWGEIRNSLTGVTSTINSTIDGLGANGGTPLADAIRLGRQAVLGAGHQSSHAAVMIVASDGIANIRLTGRWTGYPGTTYNNVACNSGSVQDAIDQANISKGDSNGDGLADAIVFSIAVGTDFNPSTMQAIATSDTVPGKYHYFRATDAASMTSIYSQISTRVADIQGDGCAPSNEPAFAPNATINIRYPDSTMHAVTTTSTGQYIINNVQPGTYTFVSASVVIGGINYNILTDGVGGPDLGSNPAVVIGGGTGTYSQDLALKTSYLPPCQ